MLASHHSNNPPVVIEVNPTDDRVSKDDMSTYIVIPLDTEEMPNQPNTRSRERARKLTRNANRTPEAGRGSNILNHRRQKAGDQDEPLAIHMCQVCQKKRMECMVASCCAYIACKKCITNTKVREG